MEAGLGSVLKDGANYSDFFPLISTGASSFLLKEGEWNP